MLERELIKDFGLSQQAAAELAQTIKHQTSQRTPTSNNNARSLRLPDIVGTLSIEGLTLTDADQRFLAQILGLGLTEAQTIGIAMVYARAKRTSKRLADSSVE